ncbi:MAG TPA: TonB-dependent receptor plug domain-containing protein [Candidatus Didemnitutus sp.]|nr:TonB-dependent receptor plug domain-containing protein [Candidatus Didemnitutus sp.]
MQANQPLTGKSRLLVATTLLFLLQNSGLAQVASPATPPPDNAAPAPQVEKKDKDASEQPIRLSPFEVDASKDYGYRANNTLAGTRINTDLRDLAGPISVVTKEFMDDVGATSANDLLTYMVGAEGTRDFQANTPELGRTGDNAAQDPNASTRGRGLSPFDVTRNYFYSLTEQPLTTLSSGTSVGFDAYNLDSVTISRGPNSVLAGLGSPAGIINYSPQEAMLGKDATELTARYGSYGDKRATFNTNIGSVSDVVAFRFAGEWSDKGFRQQPAWDKDRRLYFATTYHPFKNTTIHASFENVDIRQALPNTFTPEDDITQWLQLGKPSSPAQGVGAPFLFNGGPNSGPNVYYNPDGSIIGAYNNSGQYTFLQQNLSNVGIWSPIRFANNQYGDWDRLNTEGTREHNKLRTFEFSIDQGLAPGLNLNLAFLHEHMFSDQLQLGRPDYVADQIDVNATLPWGAPNPNFGHTYMYFAGLDNKQTTNSGNRVARGTVTYDLDLTKYNRWLGRYRLTGFLEQRQTEQDFIDYNAATSGSSTAVGGGPGVISYTGGSAANGYFTTAVAQVPSLANNQPYTNNDGTMGTLSEVYQLKEEDKHLVKLSTSAVVLQAYLLDDLVVPMVGIRRDSDDSAFADQSGGLAGDYPDLVNVSATTKTYGVVVHGPQLGSANLKWLSVFYTKSQNFIPNAGSIDLLGNATPDPTGESKDYGVSFDLFDGKLNAKLDWWKTSAINGPAPSVNFPLVQWSLPFILLSNNNANGMGAFADLAKQAGVANYTTGLAPGITTGEQALANAYTQSNVANGLEFEITYNVNKNWRIYGSVTKTESISTNIAPALTTFINERVAYWQANGLWNGPYTTKQDWSGQPETGQQVFNNDVLGPFIAYQASSGQPAQQLHRWKESLVTNYSFTDGPLNGFNFGTGLRFLDATVIGNPAIYNSSGAVVGLDLDHPYTAPAQVDVDAWIGYTMRLEKKYILSFQLRGMNLQTGGGYMPVNANSDGTHQLFTIVQPRTFYFTAKVDF